MRILLCLSLSAAALRGEETADPARARTASVEAQVDDLDFTDDFLMPRKRIPKRPAGKSHKATQATEAQAALAVPAAPEPEQLPPSRSWIYWTVGLTVLTGGAAWYIHEELEAPPSPARTTEEFTDDPG